MTAPLEVRWEHDFLVAGDGTRSPLALDVQGVVLAHAASAVSAWELATGVRRYHHRTQSIVCGLAVTSEQTHVAFRDGFEPGSATVVIIDAATGGESHRIACEGKPEGLVALAQGFAWVERAADASESMAVADAASGRVARVALPPGKTSYLDGDGGERAYLVRYDTPAQVIACTATEVAWRHEPGDGPAVHSLIAIGAQVVALRSGGGEVTYAAFDAATGALAWAKGVPPGSDATLDGTDLLVITQKQARLERWNLATGELAGKTKFPSSFGGSSLTVAVRRGVLWAQCDHDRHPLQAFDLATGKLAAQGSISWSHGPAIAVTPRFVVVNERASARTTAAVRAYDNPF